jgi:hypothetical protein
MTKQLGRNASDFLRRFPFSPSVVFASNERRQKLRLETTPASVVIVRGWRLVLTHELFLEPCIKQSLSNARLFFLQFRRYRDVSIERGQGNIPEGSRAGIEAIQPVRPSPDEDNLAEPGIERPNEFRKRFEFGDLFRSSFG